MIRNPHFHRRGDADRPMNPAEVVVRKMQAERRPLEEIVSERQRSTEILPAASRAILGKVWSCFKDQIGVGDQVAEGLKRTAVGWHTFMVRPLVRERKR